MSERVCSVEGCGQKHKGKGYWNAHWTRVKTGKDMSNPVKQQAKGKYCKITGCTNMVTALGLCSGHWARKNRGASIDDTPLRSFYRGVLCPVDGCTSVQSHNGFCRMHDIRRSKGRPLSGPQFRARVGYRRVSPDRGYVMVIIVSWNLETNVRIGC